MYVHGAVSSKEFVRVVPPSSLVEERQCAENDPEGSSWQSTQGQCKEDRVEKYLKTKQCFDCGAYGVEVQDESKKVYIACQNPACLNATCSCATAEQAWAQWDAIN